MLQVDDAHLPMMYDSIVDPGTPGDFRRWARLRIDALNGALEGLPVERTRYHICWGSFNSPHVGDVPFKEIADLVLSVDVGGYAIEMANPRHEHEWRVWEPLDLPEDKVLIPGVIAHTTNVVEHPELVAERLVRLARLVGGAPVICGTDCGFAQGPFVRRDPRRSCGPSSMPSFRGPSSPPDSSGSRSIGGRDRPARRAPRSRPGAVLLPLGPIDCVSTSPSSSPGY